MNIEHIKRKPKIEKEIVPHYWLTVTTMTGDADDYHTLLDFQFDDVSELRRMIVACEVMSRHYPALSWWSWWLQ